MFDGRSKMKVLVCLPFFFDQSGRSSRSLSWSIRIVVGSRFLADRWSVDVSFHRAVLLLALGYAVGGSVDLVPQFRY